MAHYVIGDVHGAGLELDALLDKIAPTAGDRVDLVGDVFDRGLHADRVWSLIHLYDLGSYMGNHELKAIAWLRGLRDWLPKHYYVAMNLLVESCCTPAGLLAWLEARPLLKDYGDYIITHAAVDIHFPGRQDVSINCYGSPYCYVAAPNAPGTKDDPPMPQGHERRQFWDDYDGDQVVFYGHLVARDNLPRIRRNSRGRVNSIGLDTAAVHGGPLTAVRVGDQRFYSYQSGVDWGEKCRTLYGKNNPPVIHPSLLAFVKSQREERKARLEAEKADAAPESGTAVG